MQVFVFATLTTSKSLIESAFD